jgi:hypothetical protein
MTRHCSFERALILLTACCAFGQGTLPAYAQEQPAVDLKPLTGTFYVGPAMDSEGGAPADHFYATLTGDAAKAMYEAMNVKTTPDECVGRIAKWVEGLVCYGAATDNGPPPESPYECYFGIDLKSAALEAGADC